MEELWLERKRLVSEKKWIEVIDNLKSEEIIENKEEAKKILKEKLIFSIEKRIPKERFGIFFSGGVDSSLIAAICKRLKKDFICYTVGFQENTKEPEDVIEAKKVAKKLGLELKYKIFDLNEAKEIIQKTSKLLKKVGKNDVVNIGVGSVVLAAIELASKDNIIYFLGGLGSEEIFAGYERHEKAKEINKECWNGLKKMWERDLVRDFNLAKEFSVIIKTPFLDEELIKYAMKIPAGWKIVDGKKKVVLREVAEEFLGEFAWRKKKAAQYGSCFDKAISKLARKEGFKLKKEYLDYLK
ncbi:MAG: asparagine synthase C-terminal domain-containing protein [Nanoarchaeota archaeon]|nr:asparagine synthase C-terminal domain-containing protein [Nanoarchaeota archaeon]MBU1632150.1 asparagine synthase C-terminal domain-containing protein [Nanoarchaeota archaeon]MBU1876351.1 asparagine synthase C-terminal domain-containing protein [Nanoarchaeota archaeon]